MEFNELEEQECERHRAIPVSNGLHRDYRMAA